MTEIAKRYWQNEIIRLKFMVVRAGKCMRITRAHNERIESEIKQLEQSPFNRNRIAKLESEIISTIDLREHINTVHEALIDAIMEFDQIESTSHEKAQLCGVHHSHVERIESEYGKCDLLFLVGQHCEVAGDDLYGFRSRPMFSAYLFVSARMFSNSKELQDNFMKLLQEWSIEKTGAPMKTYTAIAQSDGSISLTANLPNLTLVKG
jgi:hypothetical protein